ncbi:MAG: hypothetical protein ACYCYF_14110, partial [Anaerolineae bacterium]
SNGRYLVEVREGDREAFEAHLSGLPCARIGQVTDGRLLSVQGIAGAPLTLSLSAIEHAWRGHVASDSTGEELR